MYTRSFDSRSLSKSPPTVVGDPVLGSDPHRPITHEVYFRIHKSLNIPNLEQVCKDFTKQTNDVFTKTTNRRFNYSGTELIDQWPTWGQASQKLSSYGFKIIVYIVPPDPMFGGNCLIEGDDVVVVINTNTLTNSSLSIVNVMCHEIAHGFGVAIGEYYSIKLLIDFTETLPEYKVNIIVKDDYWHTPNHIEWLNDPMLLPNPPNPKFCWLSSYIIKSGKYRTGEPPLPDLNNIRIKISSDNVPIFPLWDVLIWRNSRLYCDKIGVYHANMDGIVEFSWNAGQSNHWTEALNDNFRIIKVFNGNIPILATGLSIWDIEENYIKSNFSKSCVYTV